MKKRLTFLLALLLLFLTGCSTKAIDDDTAFTIACTTYPVYLMTQAVAEQVPDTTVKLVVNQQVSCLHNYTLTMSDMKAMEQADLLVINGAGLEDFLSDVLETRPYLDASQGLDLLWNDEEGEYDPHLWLDPTLAGQMAQNIARGLATADAAHQHQYKANADAVVSQLTQFQAEQKAELVSLPVRQLITFHDGFSYFARAFDLKIVASVEEEEGSEASAHRIKELVGCIEQYQLPSVFIEKNGADSAANALAQECGVSIYALNMGMSGDGGGLSAYKALIQSNIDTIREAYE